MGQLVIIIYNTYVYHTTTQFVPVCRRKKFA